MSMESFNIQDLPDNWYDIIHNEGDDFIQRLSAYPPELSIMIIQIVMQTMIYYCFKPEARMQFLLTMTEAFIEQFEAWEQEDMENGQEGLE